MEALIGKARDTKDKLQELFTAKDKKTLVFTEKAGNACDIYRNRALLTSDGDKGYIQELLKDLQPREWISRERGPRFWVGVLPEWRSLPPGHNTTQGTLFVFSYGTADKKLIAMGRVQTIHIGAESPKSCELKQNSKQKFSLELCLNQNSEDVPGGGLRFVASGRSLPPISGEKVLSVVKVTREGRLTYTSDMSGDDADHWSAFRTWLSGLFGRHAADAMRWSGGCGGCWSPPGHRPGWCHLPKWSSTRTLRVPTLGKAVLLERRGFSRIVPAWRLRPGSVGDSARQAASFAAGRKAIKERAVYHAVAGWAQGGRWSESA